MSPNVRQFAVYAILAAVIAVAIPARSQAWDVSAPTITTVAIVGTELTITGENFGASPVVQLGDDTVTVVRVSNTEIVAQTPALEAGIYLLSVASHAGATPEETATSSVLVK